MTVSLGLPFFQCLLFHVNSGLLDEAAVTASEISVMRELFRLKDYDGIRAMAPSLSIGSEFEPMSNARLVAHVMKNLSEEPAGQQTPLRVHPPRPT